ncbi:MAG TPA: GvpL/GvpF family gas vesicle protein [Gaiellaceae bacterium]
MTPGNAVCAYGVVAKRKLPSRLARRGIRLVGHGSVAALVARVSAEPQRATRRALLDHAEIVEDAYSWTTILPLRFGSVFPDEAAVRELLLEPNADLFEQLLERHAGVAELTLKASYDQEALLAELVASGPGLGRLRERYRSQPTLENGIALGEKTAALLEARRDRDADRILRTIEPLALDLRVGDVGLEGGVVNLAVLVERSRVGEVEDWLEALSRDLSPPIRFRLVGPLPPYSFIDVPVAVAA